MPLSPASSTPPSAPEPEGGGGPPDAMAAPAPPSTATAAPRANGPPSAPTPSAPTPAAPAVALSSEGELKAAAILFEQMTSHASKARSKGSAADPDAVAVARFLRTTPGLSRSVVGDLLGEPAPRALAVLDAYARSFPWAGVGFEAGLRSFLEAFRLPGEAQKIYRVLDAWSRAYYDANKAAYAAAPGGDGGAAVDDASPAFASADAVHVLSFSAILLNTDAHAAAVRRKMSGAEFVANNRGINGGADLPAPFLEGLYASIVARPIRAPPGAGRGGGGEGGDEDGAAAAAATAAAPAGFLAAVGNGHGGGGPALSSSPSGGLARLGSRRSRSGAGGGWGGGGGGQAGPPPPSPPPAGGLGRPSSGGGGGGAGWLLAGSGADRGGGSTAQPRRRSWWTACLGPPA